MAATLVSEREKGTKTVLVVKGINMSSYWMSYFIFDLVRCYFTVFLTSQLCNIFELGYNDTWKLFYFLPLALIPQTYVLQYYFEREMHAQSFVIYLHFLLSSIAEIIVFALRMVQDMAVWGDRAMWLMRFVSPIFCVCNSIIFDSSADIMRR